MTHKLKLDRRVARLRALLLPVLALVFGACGDADRLTNMSDDPSHPAVAAATPLSFSRSSSGGIPFGMFHLPNDLYGSTYTGSVLYSYPEYLLANLEAARQAGASVILDFVGGNDHYKNSNGTFSLAKWKQRVDRFRNVDFSSYIEDGTIIGHYILDEPHDASNWHGTLVSPATIDQMAAYSKQFWPTLTTIVRSWPAYLKGYDYRYLDAAWSQYSQRQGEVSQFISDNVRDAKAAGLALVVGMNVLDGGTKASGIRGTSSGKYSMSGSQLRSWGSGLLADSYPCAFMSWRYSSAYMSRSEVKAAFSDLSQKARDHGSKSCRADEQGSDPGGEVLPPPQGEQPPPPPAVTEPPQLPTTEPVPPPVIGQPWLPGTQPPPPAPTPNEQPSAGGQTASSITLNVTGRVHHGRQYMTLTWSGATGRTVDVYRDGRFHKNTENDNRYTNVRRSRGDITYAFKVCEKGTSTCSNVATTTFR